MEIEITAASQFLVTFQTTSKFPIVFVGLILGRVRFDVISGPRREINISYEFDLKVILRV